MCQKCKKSPSQISERAIDVPNIINDALEYIATKTIEDSQETLVVPLNKMAKAIVEKYKDLEGRDYNLLVSTHGCASRAMLMNIAPVDLADYWRGRIPPNCAVSIAELEGGTWKLVLLDHQYAALD